MSLLFLNYVPDLPISEILNVSLTGIVVVLIVLGILAVIVQLLSKCIRLFDKKGVKTEKPAANDKADTKTASGSPLPINNSIGSLDLNNVDEKTAAVIMAIVSHESGIPLNRLEFKSIKKLS